MTTAEQARILVVDDDEGLLKTLAWILNVKLVRDLPGRILARFRR